MSNVASTNPPTTDVSSSTSNQPQDGGNTSRTFISLPSSKPASPAIPQEPKLNYAQVTSTRPRVGLFFLFYFCDIDVFVVGARKDNVREFYSKSTYYTNYNYYSYKCINKRFVS